MRAPTVADNCRVEVLNALPGAHSSSPVAKARLELILGDAELACVGQVACGAHCAALVLMATIMRLVLAIWTCIRLPRVLGLPLQTMLL